MCITHHSTMNPDNLRTVHDNFPTLLENCKKLQDINDKGGLSNSSKVFARF